MRNSLPSWSPILPKLINGCFATKLYLWLCMCFRILELQKDRYFEALSAQFWNSSARGTCPNDNDSEGITLQSLGRSILLPLSSRRIFILARIIESIILKSCKKKIHGKLNLILDSRVVGVWKRNRPLLILKKHGGRPRPPYDTLHTIVNHHSKFREVFSRFFHGSQSFLQESGLQP